MVARKQSAFKWGLHTCPILGSVTSQSMQQTQISKSDQPAKLIPMLTGGPSWENWESWVATANNPRKVSTSTSYKHNKKPLSDLTCCWKRCYMGIDRHPACGSSKMINIMWNHGSCHGNIVNIGGGYQYHYMKYGYGSIPMGNIPFLVG